MPAPSRSSSSPSRRLLAWRASSVRLLAQAGTRWRERGGLQHGAAVAFYAMLAGAPLLVLATAIAGALLGPDAVQGHVAEEMRTVMSVEAARGLQALIESAWRHPQHGALAGALGAAALLLGALGAFAALRRSFDAMAGPALQPPSFASRPRTRCAAFALVVGVGVLATASLALGTAVAALGSLAGGRAAAFAGLFAVLDVMLSALVLVVGFAALLRRLPQAPPSARAAWSSAVFCAVLFAVGKHLAALYLAHASLASSYGAAASVVVVTLWTYASAQLLLFGAALAAALDARALLETKPPARVPAKAARHPAPTSLADARARRQGAGTRPVAAQGNPWTRAPVQILQFPHERVQQRIDNR